MINIDSDLVIQNIHFTHLILWILVQHLLVEPFWLELFPTPFLKTLFWVLLSFQSPLVNWSLITGGAFYTLSKWGLSLESIPFTMLGVAPLLLHSSFTWLQQSLITSDNWCTQAAPYNSPICQYKWWASRICSRIWPHSLQVSMATEITILHLFIRQFSECTDIICIGEPKLILNLNILHAPCTNYGMPTLILLCIFCIHSSLFQWNFRPFSFIFPFI